MGAAAAAVAAAAVTAARASPLRFRPNDSISCVPEDVTPSHQGDSQRDTRSGDDSPSHSGDEGTRRPAQSLAAAHAAAAAAALAGAESWPPRGEDGTPLDADEVHEQMYMQVGHMYSDMTQEGQGMGGHEHCRQFVTWFACWRDCIHARGLFIAVDCWIGLISSKHQAQVLVICDRSKHQCTDARLYPHHIMFLS